MNTWWFVSWALGMGAVGFGFWLLRDDPHPATGWPSGSAGLWFLISLVVGTFLTVLPVRSIIQALTTQDSIPVLGAIGLTALACYSFGRRWLSVGACLLLTAGGLCAALF